MHFTVTVHLTDCAETYSKILDKVYLFTIRRIIPSVISYLNYAGTPEVNWSWLRNEAVQLTWIQHHRDI